MAIRGRFSWWTFVDDRKLEDMSLAPATPVIPSVPARFDTAADWLASLGDVPLDRILFDPWPGTATEADLLRYVERDKRLCELVDGTLVEKPMGYEEGLIEAVIIAILDSFVRAHKFGVVGSASTTMRILPNAVRLPDVAFISAARHAARDPNAAVPAIAPDLAVEVLSETNTRKEMALKLDEYFEAGTRLVWYVDPRTKTVDVYTSTTAVTRLTEADTITGGDVLPGFSANVAEFFAIE